MSLNWKDLKFSLLILLSFLVAAVETDIYLPAFTDMKAAFMTDEVMIARVLSFNFLGLCIGSLIYGPTADFIGRRPTLATGYVLFVIGSLGCIVAGTAEVLVFFRFLQGLGSAACFIVGTVMVFDRYRPAEAAKVVSLLNSVVVAVMALAPVLGGAIVNHLGFRWNFVFVAFCSVVSAIACLMGLPETLADRTKKKPHFPDLIKSYKAHFASGTFMLNSLIVGLFFGGYMIYVAHLPFLLVDHLGVEKQTLPWYQTTVLASFVISSLLFGKILTMIGPKKLTWLSISVILGSSTLAWLCSDFIGTRPLLINLVMCLYTAGVGLSMGFFFAQAMAACPAGMGIGSSLAMAIRLCVSAITVDLAAGRFDGTMQTLSFPVMLCSFCALAAFAATQMRASEIADTRPNPISL